MKKLVLITSLFVCCAFIGACQSHSKSSNTSTKKSGAKKSNSQSNSIGSSATGTGSKDTIAVKSGTAILHGEPNQSQLDSLKKVKTNSKLEK